MVFISIDRVVHTHTHTSQVVLFHMYFPIRSEALSDLPDVHIHQDSDLNVLFLPNRLQQLNLGGVVDNNRDCTLA